MLIFLLNLLLNPQTSGASTLQCYQIFTVKISSLTSSHEIEDPRAWFAGFKKQNPSSKEALQKLIAAGKTNLRQGTYSLQHQNVFRWLIHLKKADLIQLESSDLLDIFKLFSSWNLYPPRDFQNHLWGAMTVHLPQWTSKDYMSFALARKLNPLTPTQAFLSAWKKEIFKNFSQLNATTQLEVLGAELLHQTRFSSAETQYLLKTVTQTVLAQQKPLHIKPLKEMFRALMVLRALEPSSFFVPMVRLEQAIEQHLQAQGMSLDQAGRSGDERSSSPLRSVPPLRLWLEQQLNMAFGFTPKIYEYTNAAQFGFFDPVDIFFPEMHLIVEWDGRHHYFNKIDSNAKIIVGHDQLVLRPMDSARDAILRHNGHSILRIPIELNSHLQKTDIVDLIKKQNPYFEANEYSPSIILSAE